MKDENATALPPGLSDSFERIRALGSGAMGEVLLARDRALDRLVALKLLQNPEKQELRDRFVREAAGLVKVRHPNVVEIYDYGVAGETPYIVMEYVEGKSLEGERPADPLALMLPVADALDALHAVELVHRDLKPANIMRTEDGRPVLVDFGLLQAGGGTELTRTGMIVGTMAYLAPEVFRASSYGAPVDWYAWGVTLYQLCTGRLPFDATAVLLRMEGAADVEPREMPEDPGLRAVILRCLEADPRRRPSSRGEIEEILSRHEASARETDPGRSRAQPAVRVSGPSTATVPRRSRPRFPAMIGVLALLVLLGSLLTPSSDSPAPAPDPARSGPRFFIFSVLPSGLPVYETEEDYRVVYIPDGSFTPEGSGERVYLGAFLLSFRPHEAVEPGGEEALARELGGRLPTQLELERAAGLPDLAAPGFRVAFDPPPGVALPEERLKGAPLADILLPKGPNDFGHRRFRNLRDGSTLIEVPEGDFLHRTALFEEGRPEGTRMHLDRFLIQRCEVRVRRYAVFLRATGHPPPERWPSQVLRPDFPAVLMKWSDAREYCRWAGGRLPTDAEWTRAAGGAEGWTYPWGEEPPDEKRANFGSDELGGRFNPFPYLQKVKKNRKGRSPVGAWNMAGNVYEWVEDETRIQRHPGEIDRVIKGGNYIAGEELLRTWVHRAWKADNGSIGIGFRCVFDPP